MAKLFNFTGVMIQFILNNKPIATDLPGGTILLDFIRKEAHLPGTKTGCREGDCGACTVLDGRLKPDNKVHYQSITSCLTPIINVHGKHIVTIEGLNLKNNLNQVQHAMKEHNATQCGFCTPGFVVAFTGYTLNKETSIQGIRESISGNICRCTGYKSIEKAAVDIFSHIKVQPKGRSLDWLIKHHFIPDYFKEIPARLQQIEPITSTQAGIVVGGGTDLYVQKADQLLTSDLLPVQSRPALHGIQQIQSKLIIGAGCTPSDLLNSDLLMKYFPQFNQFFQLISSQVIRNMGTLGGNFVNASPIGDLSIIFLALNADLTLINLKTQQSRNLPLREFFIDYKKTALQPDELIQSISIEPHQGKLLNFEKVSKRTYLDIASVNSAMSIHLSGNEIKEIHLSAGGVAPIPKYLKNTCAFLKGKELNTENIRKAHCVLKEEITPINDVRGSAEYKRLLLRQLFYGHFIRLFKNKVNPTELLNLSSS
jgi:xanthine dehydrogenase small subunit